MDRLFFSQSTCQLNSLSSSIQSNVVTKHSRIEWRWQLRCHASRWPPCPSRSRDKPLTPKIWGIVTPHRSPCALLTAAWGSWDSPEARAPVPADSIHSIELQLVSPVSAPPETSRVRRPREISQVPPHTVTSHTGSPLHPTFNTNTQLPPPLQPSTHLAHLPPHHQTSFRALGRAIT